MRRLNEKLELEVYQLFKRHRVVPTDPTYEPSISVSTDGSLSIDFNIYDNRLKKYFTGEAFTEKYGYRDGPGYGQPIEQFVLPSMFTESMAAEDGPTLSKPALLHVKIPWICTGKPQSSSVNWKNRKSISMPFSE